MDKMTNEEAIECLVRIDESIQPNSRWWRWGFKEALKIAIKAIKKQIAKKPIGAYKTCDTGEITYWKCPTCNYKHKTNWGSCDTDHCHNCGQAIDWSED